MKTGIYDNIKNDDYHSNDGHYSSTLIKKMEIPALAKHHMEAPQEHKECYRIGSAIHSYVLEPSVFQREFLIGLDIGRKSKADRMQWAQWFSDNGADGYYINDLPAAEWNGEFSRQTGKHIITPDEINKISAMAKSVFANKNAAILLEGGDSEQSVYWEDDDTGLGLKVRPDYINERFITDLKSCLSIKDEAINRAFATLDYGVSQSMYQDGVNKVTGKWKPFVFLFIDKNPPYLCRVIALDDFSQEHSWEKYQKLKSSLADCIKNNKWPTLEDNMKYALPPWAL